MVAIRVRISASSWETLVSVVWVCAHAERGASVKIRAASSARMVVLGLRNASLAGARARVILVAGTDPVPHVSKFRTRVFESWSARLRLACGPEARGPTF